MLRAHPSSNLRTSWVLLKTPCATVLSLARCDCSHQGHSSHGPHLLPHPGTETCHSAGPADPSDSGDEVVTSASRPEQQDRPGHCASSAQSSYLEPPVPQAPLPPAPELELDSSLVYSNPLGEKKQRTHVQKSRLRAGCGLNKVPPQASLTLKAFACLTLSRSLNNTL